MSNSLPSNPFSEIARLYRLGLYQNALTILDGILAGNDASLEALHWKGRCLSKMGRWEEAASIFKWLSLQSRTNAIYGLYHARALFALKKGPEATVLIDTILSEGQHSAYEYFLGGLFNLENGEFTSAAKYYKKAAQQDNKNANVWVQWAICIFQMSDLPGAIRKIREAVTLLPENSQIQYLLGYFLFLKGDYNEAIHQLKKSIELGGNQWRPNFFAGLASAELGEHRHAIEFFQCALKTGCRSKNLRQDDVHVCIAKEYAMLNSFDRAVHYLDEALALNDSNIEANYLKVLFLFVLGKYEGFDACLQQALLVAQHFDRKFELGVLLFFGGCLEEAIAAFQNCVDTCIKRPEANFCLAALYWEMMNFSRIRGMDYVTSQQASYYHSEQAIEELKQRYRVDKNPADALMAGMLPKLIYDKYKSALSLRMRKLLQALPCIGGQASVIRLALYFNSLSDMSKGKDMFDVIAMKYPKHFEFINRWAEKRMIKILGGLPLMLEKEDNAIESSNLEGFWSRFFLRYTGLMLVLCGVAFFRESDYLRTIFVIMGGILLASADPNTYGIKVKALGFSMETKRTHPTTTRPVKSKRPKLRVYSCIEIYKEFVGIDYKN